MNIGRVTNVNLHIVLVNQELFPKIFSVVQEVRESCPTYTVVPVFIVMELFNDYRITNTFSSR